MSDTTPSGERTMELFDSGDGGHVFARSHNSPSGKMGWRCVCCGHYSNAPVKAKFDQCPQRAAYEARDLLAKGART